MKKIILYFCLMPLFILTTATQCEDDDSIVPNCEILLENIEDIRLEIEDIANASICSDAFECRYVPFGSKACGGPKGYLIYTTSIDTLALISRVEAYNQLESEYNSTCNQFSDCTVPPPPVGFECQNNNCIPLF